MYKRFLLALGAALLVPVAVAQQPSIEDLWRPPAYSSVTISRNGKHFAVTIPINGRMNVAVIDLETRKGVALTNFKDYDVFDLRWVGNDRLLFTLDQYNTPDVDRRGGGLFMISRDGKESQRLSPTFKDLINQRQYVFRRYGVVRGIPNNDEEIIASGNMRDADSFDLYRLNIRTGKAVLLTPNRPERTQGWILDRNRVPRVAVSGVKDSNIVILHYRKSEEAQFEEILRFDARQPGGVRPLYFEADNQTLHVAYNGGDRATSGVYRYDPNTKKLGELLLDHPKFDMGAGSAEIDPLTDEVLGYTVFGERTETTWLTESDKRIQRVLEKALPETANSWRRIRGDLYLVTAYSDRHPTTWYLYDEGKKTIEDLFSSKPWLSPKNLAEMKPFYLKTRDGLEILSYYFLPPNRKPGEKLPTVVHIHGGPAARADIWGRQSFGWREAQLLASRGYAVILPNFRVTPGLGNKIYYSGMGTMGRQMVDDHEDAAKWAVQEGIADPNRICISGASYGGYATLMSLARFPNTFKCGISGLMVSDWELILTSPSGDTAGVPEAVQFGLDMIGVKRTSDIPKEVSPAFLADRIKQPVLIYAGGEDVRTPIEQTGKMIRALERAGNPPKAVIIKPEESHGFAKLENSVDLYKQILEFLDTHIGPKSKP